MATDLQCSTRTCAIARVTSSWLIAAAAGLMTANADAAATIVSDACPALWQMRAGTQLDDEIHAAARDSAGNVYLGGYENGRRDIENFWPVGDVRAFLEKRSPAGSLLWRQVFDTRGIDILEAIALDPLRHRVVVAGRTSGTLAGGDAGQFDLFIAAFDEDAQGDMLGISLFGDQYPQHPTGIVVTPSGDVVVSGYDDQYVEGNAVLGQQTMWVARFSPNTAAPDTFSQRWWRQPNIPGMQTPLSAAYGLAAGGDSGEDVFVVTRSTARGAGSRLTRFDENGEVVWDSRISPTSADPILGVTTAASGRLFIAGTTGIALAGENLGNSDGFLMEVDPESGATVWGRQFGSKAPDFVWTLSADNDGRLYVGGLTSGSVVPGAAAADSIFALSFSDDGEPLGGWQSALSVPASFTDSMSIVPACAGNVLVAGHLQGSLAGSNDLGRHDAVVVPARMTIFNDAVFATSFE